MCYTTGMQLRKNVILNKEETEKVQIILKSKGISFSWLVRNLLSKWLKSNK